MVKASIVSGEVRSRAWSLLGAILTDNSIAMAVQTGSTAAMSCSLWISLGGFMPACNGLLGEEKGIDRPTQLGGLAFVVQHSGSVLQACDLGPMRNATLAKSATSMQQQCEHLLALSSLC